MGIGSHDKRLTLNKPTRISNGRGGIKTDYDTGEKIVVWASFRLLNINEQLRYNDRQQAANAEVEIRDVYEVDLTTRVLYQEKIYRITEIAPGERAGWRLLRVTEVNE